MNDIQFDLARTLPANPGFFVVHALCDDNGYPGEVDQTPVVAWAFEVGSLAPYPVTLDGLRTDSVYILQPHGAVSRAEKDSWPSVADWLKSQQDEYTEELARLA